jgi:hypothetical protein
VNRLFTYTPQGGAIEGNAADDTLLKARDIVLS